MSSTSRALRATSVPSARAPVSSSITIPSRRWPTATNSSRREKTSLTGRPRRARERGDVPLEVEVALGAEAAAEQRHDDAHVRGSGIWSTWATPSRAAYGTCVDVQTVTLSPCHWAITARGSIGTPCTGSVT